MRGIQENVFKHTLMKPNSKHFCALRNYIQKNVYEKENFVKMKRTISSVSDLVQSIPEGFLELCHL